MSLAPRWIGLEDPEADGGLDRPPSLLRRAFPAALLLRGGDFTKVPTVNTGGASGLSPRQRVAEMLAVKTSIATDRSLPATGKRFSISKAGRLQLVLPLAHTKPNPNSPVQPACIQVPVYDV